MWLKRCLTIFCILLHTFHGICMQNLGRMYLILSFSLFCTYSSTKFLSWCTFFWYVMKIPQPVLLLWNHHLVCTSINARNIQTAVVLNESGQVWISFFIAPDTSLSAKLSAMWFPLMSIICISYYRLYMIIAHNIYIATI